MADRPSAPVAWGVQCVLPEQMHSNENRIETPTNEDLICFHSVLLVPKYVVVGREGRMLPVGVECGSGRWFP